MMGCVDCGAPLHQQIEKALEGEPREALVWADNDDDWVCEVTRNEHDAADLSPFEVEYTVVVHVLAKDAEAAFEVGERIATKTAVDQAWSTYDDCVTPITEESF